MFVELLLSLSVIMIFGLFAIRPTLVTIVGLNKNIESKNDTVSRLDSKINALVTAEEIYSRNLQAINVLNQAIPSSAYPALFVRQVEGLAKRHQIDITNLNSAEIPLITLPSAESVEVAEASPEKPASDFPSSALYFEFEVNVFGSYQNTIAFLNDFEKMRSPFLQDSINIQLSDTDTRGQLTTVISGKLTYLP